MSVVVRAAERGVTRGVGTQSHHGFSFGHHWVADRVEHGPLTAHNEERLEAGAGFGDHPHRDVELVTWVLSGALRHSSDLGRATLHPGQVQHLGAGTGVVHRETSEVATTFVQAWLRPTAPSLPPCHAVADAEPGRDWSAVVSGLDDVPAALGLRSSAALLIARPVCGDVLTVPDAPLRHLWIAAGGATAGGQSGATVLGPGDALLDRDTGALELRAGGFAGEECEVHCWLLHP